MPDPKHLRDALSRQDHQVGRRVAKAESYSELLHTLLGELALDSLNAYMRAIDGILLTGPKLWDPEKPLSKADQRLEQRVCMIAVLHTELVALLAIGDWEAIAAILDLATKLNDTHC